MAPSTVKDQALERQATRLGRSARWWLLVGTAAVLPGIVLFVVGLVAGLGWLWAFGLAVILIGGCPLVIGLGLGGSSVVSRWSARHRSFA